MITHRDRAIIVDLARRVADIASLPIMEERRQMWVRHNRLERVRPMILVFPEGSWRELLPESVLQCEGEEARRIEWELRRRIYHHEHIHDDTPIESSWVVQKAITQTGWGLEARHKPSTEQLGAWAFDPVIKEPADLQKLQFPQVHHDPEATAQRLEQAQDLFGDILDVQLKGISHISFHLMSQYTGLRGLEQVMWDMYDQPAMLHEAMSILEEGNRRLVQQYVDLNLLSLNNDSTYHSSGGVGYTTELPRPDYDPQRIRPCDMWASAEAQEMAQVSPPMHAEFILPYEKRLLEPFGLNGYGCCEDLTDKLDDVFTIPNLRRISISPFANVDRCAEKLQANCIFSWKPHPAHLVGQFSPDKIKDYIAHTLQVTRGCVIEMILKDTHTCDHHPERFTIWTDIAQELAQSY
ncbi:MAG: hypothetical protein GX552_13935 [Chloroflexi bacterium]|jgi:hypothetical protein|nr:hypothetical protein [Chloroflexota bacterium]